MPITNLHLARKPCGTAPTLEEIQLGVEFKFKNNTGGVTNHKCISIENDKAVFESTRKDWPSQFIIEFKKEFTLIEFSSLSEAIKAFNSWSIYVTKEHRAIVHKAHDYGYAVAISYTQAQWTKLGIEVSKKIQNKEQSCKNLN